MRSITDELGRATEPRRVNEGVVDVGDAVEARLRSRAKPDAHGVSAPGMFSRSQTTRSRHLGLVEVDQDAAAGVVDEDGVERRLTVSHPEPPGPAGSGRVERTEHGGVPHPPALGRDREVGDVQPGSARATTDTAASAASASDTVADGTIVASLSVASTEAGCRSRRTVTTTSPPITGTPPTAWSYRTRSWCDAVAERPAYANVVPGRRGRTPLRSAPGERPRPRVPTWSPRPPGW